MRRPSGTRSLTFDRFHVAQLAHKALDAVRRKQVRELDPDDRRALKNTRWALLRGPEALTDRDDATLAYVHQVNKPLFRAYILTDAFLAIFDYCYRAIAKRKLNEWLAWASRSRLQPFVKLARTVRQHMDGILAFFDARLTTPRLEGMNNKIRLLPHRAYGFHRAVHTDRGFSATRAASFLQ